MYLIKNWPNPLKCLSFKRDNVVKIQTGRHTLPLMEFFFSINPKKKIVGTYTKSWFLKKIIIELHKWYASLICISATCSLKKAFHTKSIKKNLKCLLKLISSRAHLLSKAFLFVSKMKFFQDKNYLIGEQILVDNFAASCTNHFFKKIFKNVIPSYFCISTFRSTHFKVHRFDMSHSRYISCYIYYNIKHVFWSLKLGFFPSTIYF